MSRYRDGRDSCCKLPMFEYVLFFRWAHCNHKTRRLLCTRHTHTITGQTEDPTWKWLRLTNICALSAYFTWSRSKSVLQRSVGSVSQPASAAKMNWHHWNGIRHRSVNHLPAIGTVQSNFQWRHGADVAATLDVWRIVTPLSQETIGKQMPDRPIRWNMLNVAFSMIPACLLASYSMNTSHPQPYVFWVPLVPISVSAHWPCSP